MHNIPVQSGWRDLGDLTVWRFALIFIACFAIAALPVLAVETLPLFDYPNHLARMHILANPEDPLLQRFYEIRWQILPNLAMDIVVPPLARIMPLAWAGKVFVLLILLLLAGGAAALHRTLFGRWSLFSCLAFLLLYNRILLWGFVNFLFGIGLAVVILTLWLRLREAASWRRVAVGTIGAAAIYLSHLFAFGVYAIVIAGTEIGRLWRNGTLWTRRGIADLATAALQFVIPLALLILGERGPGGGIGWGQIWRKIDLFFNVFDNYSRVFDITCFVALLALLIWGAIRRSLRIAPALMLPMLLLLLVQLAMPNRMFGGAGVDHRMPLVLGLLLVAGGDAALRTTRQKAIAGGIALLFVVRIGIVTAVWLADDRIYHPIVAALAELPRGSRLAVALPPNSVNLEQRRPPITHLANLAIIETDAFVPLLFDFPGQQPVALRPAYAALARQASPEDFWAVLVGGAPDAGGKVAAALAGYDFILLVDPVAFTMPQDPRLTPRFASPNGRLYAIAR
ncbi:MAG: hypothetical protein JWL84_4054 [Rhodospirillales bacterium]|nr:hypothetical protein [Rhodospirillales bacterium]